MGKKDEKEYLTILYEARRYASEQYDKLIVYLSGGALTLTLGFVKILDLTKIKDLSLLFSAWVYFIVSLLIILISHRTSIWTMDFEISGKEKKSNFWNLITEILNWLAMMALIVGIAQFIYFVKMALSAKGC